MTKLYEFLGKGRVKGDFGIEIECEGANLPVIPAGTAWNQCDDGSLRGEYPLSRSEYVLRKPLNIDECDAAIKYLIEQGAKCKSVFNFSFRTSVHVHLNVTELTVNQYLNLVYTYYIIEEALIRYCGDERVGNRFCLRLRDADNLVNHLTMLFNDTARVLYRLNLEELKYAAINLAATPRYGSLEFRGMSGNLNPDYIRVWLKALGSLREFATKFENPKKIHDHFVQTNPSLFLEEVLQDSYRFFSYEDEVHDMRTNFSLSLELPYNYVETKIPEKEVKPKKIEMRFDDLVAGDIPQVRPAEPFGDVNLIQDDYDLRRHEWAVNLPQNLDRNLLKEVYDMHLLTWRNAKEDRIRFNLIPDMPVAVDPFAAPKPRKRRGAQIQVNAIADEIGAF